MAVDTIYRSLQNQCSDSQPERSHDNQYFQFVLSFKRS